MTFKVQAILLIVFIGILPGKSNADTIPSSIQQKNYRQYITEHYAEQLGTPEKKKRKNFSQFGYGLSFYAFPLFPITDFITADDYGTQSYGKTNLKEKNGALYTCRGGFIDFSHVRTAMDWTVHVAFKILDDKSKEIDMQSTDGILKLRLKNINHLRLTDIAAMSQKIAFERLAWHELASWYYHLPNFTYSEQQSTFTPEDTYSNSLGTLIGKKIILRILLKQEGLSYEQIASEELKKEIALLLPVSSKEDSKHAYDIVDAAKQAKLPEAEQNKDVWWDSRVQFRDERYVFKRYISIGPLLSPWLVPRDEQVGCKNVKPQVLAVPQRTKSGTSFYNYYTLTIKPDSILFYDKKTHEKLHEPFGTFTTNNMQKIITQVKKEMEKALLTGFNKRNKENPEDQYEDKRKVWFR
ncbi:MAG: hypothetical protein JWN78_2665 [Bacteroidota bacterium]|nr:hypothetical protein [Bacteroidota bacterium]